MTFTMIFITTFFTGLVLGVAATALFALSQYGQARRIDAERMRLWNKLLAKEGQSPIFTDGEITKATGTVSAEPREVTSEPSRTIRSPFQAGKLKMRKHLSEQEKVDNGSRVPEPIRNVIAQAAEKARAMNGHG